MSKQKIENNEPGLEEAKKLIQYLFQSYNLSTLNLSQRELDLVKMKWIYGLKDEQIAEKMSIKEARVKKLYEITIRRIFRHMLTLYSDSDVESLKKEIKKLRAENYNYKMKFQALSSQDKGKFEKLDIVVKSVEAVGLSSKTSRALTWINIWRVSDLLQYRLSSLLLMKGFSLKMVEEIDMFTRKNHLKMRD